MSDKEIKFNLKMDECVDEMNSYLETGEGDPEKILVTLIKIANKMDKNGFEHAALTSMEGYSDLMLSVGDDDGSGSDSDSSGSDS